MTDPCQQLPKDNEFSYQRDKKDWRPFKMAANFTHYIIVDCSTEEHVEIEEKEGDDKEVKEDNHKGYVEISYNDKEKPERIKTRKKKTL